MPELPEAETIARQLHARIAGKHLGEVRALRKDMVHGHRTPLHRVLLGQKVERVYRRAKRVVLELSGPAMSPASLIFTLGMTGSVTVNRHDDPIEKHTHFRIAISDSDQELRFCDPRRFGGIWFLRGEGKGEKTELPARKTKRKKGKVQRRTALGPVGPEPLELKPREFSRLLQRKRAIKALLMDQTIIAGLGNIYCDESLFAAGIHPLRTADSLTDDEAKRLLRAVKSTLRRAIRFNGSTFMDYRSADGEPGSFQRFHRVYNRAGQTCRACETAIERIIVAGRSSCFCRICQPVKALPLEDGSSLNRPK